MMNIGVSPPRLSLYLDQASCCRAKNYEREFLLHVLPVCVELLFAVLAYKIHRK
jgi:hypothetical protein